MPELQFEKLLAKSIPARDAQQDEQEYRKVKGVATFTGHIGAVLSAAEISCKQLQEKLKDQLKLEPRESDRVIEISKLGAYLHDWGKANQHFQEMVYINSSILDAKNNEKVVKKWKEHGSRQLIRHEFLSGILALQVPKFKKWLLEKFTEEELVIAVSAAIGHHLKAGLDSKGNESNHITELSEGTGSTLFIYTDHADFQKVLQMGSKRLGLSQDIPMIRSRNWEKKELQDKLQSLKSKFDLYEETLSKKKVIIAAVKAMVIAADLAGSALPAEGENLPDWITTVLGLGLTADDLEALIQQKLGTSSLRDFQQKMAAAESRVTLVIAGCGTGKTLGSYAWGKKWAIGRRLFFCYPTTGTATQGYLDYVEGSEIESMLMHSRADLDRELLFSGEGEADEGISSRLAALQTWRKKLVVCTVDAVLGLVQNNRRSLYSWPALVQSAFVFDEVHAYDDRLFGALLRFLQTFRGAPILLMSASFTQGQLRAIQDVLQGEMGEPIQGPQELEKLKRYRLCRVDVQSNDIWSEIETTIEENQKVLWVTNSVSSCINIYHLVKQKFKDKHVTVCIYHSRFRYKDRLQKHKQVIEAFRASGAVIAITTQVCEMSLDLSADLLISAMAPATALIQRLGRLNRRMTEEGQGTRLALFYPWDQPQPYEPSELASGDHFVKALSQREAVSQHDLATIAAKLNQKVPEAVTSAWLDQNWRTYPDSLREAGYTITVLLAEDQNLIQQAAAIRYQNAQLKGQKLSKRQAFLQEAQAWSIPIRIPPPKTEWWNWKRCGFYLITAPGYIQYSEEVGTP